MAAIAKIKIADPDKPGDYLNINASDFDEAVHTPFKEGRMEPDMNAQPTGRMLGAGSPKTADEGDDADGDEIDRTAYRAKLLKTRKADLVAIAVKDGHDIVPDEMNIKQIVDLIMGPDPEE